MIRFSFPFIISIGLLFLIGGCFAPRTQKSLLPSSPSLILKRIRRDAPQYNYRGFVIKGSLYYFSKKRNFRGFFILKGNKDYPWIMELRWSMGNLVSLGKVKEGKCELYLVHDNTIYQSKSFSSLFGILGFSPYISPSLWLKLLTGEWKKTIPSPVKVLSSPGGYEFFFKGYFLSEMDVVFKGEEGIKEIVLKFPLYGGYIRIYSHDRMEFVSPAGEKSMLKIKEIALFSSSLPKKQLEIKFPPGTKRVWLENKK